MQARRTLKATAAIAAGFALASPGAPLAGGSFHGGGFHHAAAPTFAAGSITARPFIFGGFRTPRLPKPGPHPGFGLALTGHGPHGMRSGGHGPDGHDHGFPGWGYGWGWDGGYAPQYEDAPDYEEAGPPVAPAALREPAPPICPALFEWSPKLGRAVRHDLCKAGEAG